MRKKIAGMLTALCLLTACSADHVATKEEQEYVFYLKNGEVFYTALEKVEPKQLTRELSPMGSGEWGHLRWYDPQVKGDRVYFLDVGVGKEDKEEEMYTQGMDLFYRDLNDPDGKNILIDEDVADFMIGEDNVLYDKMSGELHQWIKGGVKERIADDLKTDYRPEYKMSEDGKRFAYLNEKGVLYFRDSGKEEFVDSGVDLIQSMNRNGSVLLYIKIENGSHVVYCKEAGKPSERLGESSGGIFYREEAYFENHEAVIERSIPLTDLIENDLGADHPIAKDLQAISDNRPIGIYGIYYVGEDRLYRLDGEYYIWRWPDAPVDPDQLSHRRLVKMDLVKPKLSEFQKAGYAVQAIYKKMFENSERFFPVNEKSIRLDEGDLDMFSNQDGTKLYFYRDVKNRRGDLYVCEIDQDGAGEAKKLLEDVDILTTIFVKEGQIWAYLDESEDNDGILYVNGKIMDEGIASFMTDHDRNDQVLYYEVQDKTDGRFSKLRSYRDGKVKTISEKCFHKNMSASGKLTYIADRDYESETGDLYYYDGEKSILLDKNVERIIDHYTQFSLVRE